MMLDFKLFNQKTLSDRQRQCIILCSIILLILTALIDLLNPVFICFGCLLGILIAFLKQQYKKIKLDNPYKQGLEIILCTLPFILFLQLIVSMPKDAFFITIPQLMILIFLSEYFSRLYLFKTR